MAVHRLDLIERSETLTAQVAEKLRAALIGGVFAPGDKITIRAVAKSLGVSLTPAREALSILAAEGALEFGANRTLMVPPLSVDRLAEITRIRIALEGLAAERAARLSGGSITWLSEGGTPALRSVAPGRDSAGSGWIGLRRNRDHLVTGIADLPLMPPWAALLLIVGGLVWAWRREGR